MVDPALKAALEAPIGNPEQGGFHAENRQAARRAQKIWLPEGKVSPASQEAKARRQELLARQIDIEDAVEAAGGQRGALKA